MLLLLLLDPSCDRRHHHHHHRHHGYHKDEDWAFFASKPIPQVNAKKNSSSAVAYLVAALPLCRHILVMSFDQCIASGSKVEVSLGGSAS